MKKIKIGLPILAFVLAVATSAFTVMPNQQDGKTTDPMFYWFEYDASTGTLGQPVDQDPLTHSEAIGGTCLDDGNIQCRRGYLASQLEVTGDPDSGVKEEEVDNEQDSITKD